MTIDDRMLKELGIVDVGSLFADIPTAIRKEGINIQNGLDELEVVRAVREMLSSDLNSENAPCFLGAGIYDHFIPAAVKSIIMRSEFITSYTPYQSEISQGMLQAMFEYQSLVSELTAMDVVNSSNYDGSTALGEAATMCHRILPKKKFLIPEAMSWEKKSVLRNYLWGPQMQAIEYGYDQYTGCIDLEHLASKLDGDVCGIYAEAPNFFGIIDPTVLRLKKRFPEIPLVIGIDPISLGLLMPPGEYGADIVIGEGQSLGSPMNFGGPLLGMFACRREHVRKMPGRLIGMTKDKAGERAFCMTLQTREQHIRRSKATSNICTNESLMAVAAAVYLSVVGPKGLKAIANANITNARNLMARIDELDGFDAPIFKAYHFNEFVVRTGVRPERLGKHLARKGIIGGLDLARHIPSMNEHVLFATTEMHSEADHDKLIAALREAA
jgi:glycine dehydrogenase subunit 1